MLFVAEGSGREEFEGIRGHMWEGIPTFQEVKDRVGNMVVNGVRMHAALNLPVERVGAYVSHSKESRGTYDGVHLRVWVVWEGAYGSGEQKWQNLERVYKDCVDLYFDIARGRLEPRGSL